MEGRNESKSKAKGKRYYADKKRHPPILVCEEASVLLSVQKELRISRGREKEEGT